MSADLSRVTPLAQMQGDDQEDTDLLKAAQAEADAYVRSFAWCRGVKEVYFGAGVGGVVAVFLYRVDAPPRVDEWLWVVVGDVPSAYLVTDRARVPAAALEVYCELMEGWIEAVRSGTGLDSAFPVAAQATPENADLLERRVEFIRKRIIPSLP